MEDKILKKIKKCLALARSSNPNEAATALRQAQALMHEHGINEADVALADVAEFELHTGSADNPPRWFIWLVSTINAAFGVDAIYNIGQTTSISFIGIDSNAEIAGYAFDLLFRQIRRDRSEHVARLSNRCKRATKTRKGDVFAEAWVKAVHHKVVNFAMPPEQKELIEQYKKQRHPDLEVAEGRAAKPDVNADGASYQAGWQAGKSAQLNHGMTGSRQGRLEV